jgi:hypothetical protein
VWRKNVEGKAAAVSQWSPKRTTILQQYYAANSWEADLAAEAGVPLNTWPGPEHGTRVLTDALLDAANIHVLNTGGTYGGVFDLDSYGGTKRAAAGSTFWVACTLSTWVPVAEYIHLRDDLGYPVMIYDTDVVDEVDDDDSGG